MAVVDCEKGKKYPENFICTLPGQLGSPACIFDQLYGRNAKEMAKKLLTEALDKEADPEVKLEIEKRLKMIASARV